MSKRNTQYAIRNTNNVFAVVLVGGKGKRLRPLSTDRRPKAFLSVTKDRKTMFKKTLERARKLVAEKDVVVCANASHAGLVKKDFPGIKKENLLLEPVSRNTAPAIGLAAMALKKIAANPIMVVMPADQYIPDEEKYLTAIRDAVRFAAENERLVLLGLKPAYPATAFGYVRIRPQARRPGAKNIYKAMGFVEKPDLKTAKRYVKDGRYLWNAGAFVFKANSILKSIREHAPAIYSLLMQAGSGNISRIYPAFPDISIDYVVMEHADNIYCVKGGYRWQDIGSFDALREVLKREGRAFVEKGGKVIKIS